MEAAVQEKPKHTIQLGPERFLEAEYQINRWVVNADEGTKQADILAGDYWGHVAAKLKPGDHIYVRADNMSWYSELFVLSVSRAFAVVKALNEWRWGDEAAEEAQRMVQQAAPFRTKWGGPHYKWTVIRMSDNQRVAESLPDERAAINWITEHEKAN